ncbi:Cobalt-zinc-cadmium resistance protein CzcB [bacterium HR15]|nr:Cobalt-zinc-cadmium resistance protein CzcB [bacterium HR15]
MNPKGMLCPTRKARRWLGIAALSILSMGVWWWLNRPVPSQDEHAESHHSLPDQIELSPESLQLAQLEIETVQRKPLRRPVRLFGRIEPMPEHLVNLNARVSGRLVELRARVGDWVRRGQVLAILDSDEIQRAEIAYAQASRRVEFARKELARRRQMAQLGAFSDPPLEEARARFTQAQADLKNAESDYQQAQQALREAQAARQAAQVELQRAETQLRRGARLLAAQLISQQEYENLQAQHALAQAELQQTEARLQRAEATLTSSQSRLQTAQETYYIAQQSLQRAERLHKGQYLTSKEVAEAESAYQQALLEQQAALDTLRLLGGRPNGGHKLVLTAPFDGRVVELNATLGETVTPDKPIFRLLSTRTVWITFDLYPDEVPFVRIGQAVRFRTEAVPDKVFEATLQMIMPAADPSAQIVRARCVVSNPDGRLKPGFFVSGELTLTLSMPVLLVPAEAVQQIEGESYLFVATEREGVFQLRRVQVGRELDHHVVIQRGLQEGERIVTRNASLLKGMLIGGGEH